MEDRVRTTIGQICDREWYIKAFAFLKQEPRDTASDRFHVSSSMMMAYTFGLMYDGLTKATLSEVKEEVAKVFGDGSDKTPTSCHCGDLGCSVGGYKRQTSQSQDRDLGVRFSNFPKDFLEWSHTGEHFLLDNVSPRDTPGGGIHDDAGLSWIGFHLSGSIWTLMLSSKKVPKSSCLQQMVADVGWHFRLGEPIIADFLNHLDHPYKGVCEKQSGNVYLHFMVYSITSPTKTFQVLSRLKMRLRRWAPKLISQPPSLPSLSKKYLSASRNGVKSGQLAIQKPSPYTSGSKTVLLWLDNTLISEDCTQLLPFFADLFSACTTSYDGRQRRSGTSRSCLPSIPPHS